MHKAPTYLGLGERLVDTLIPNFTNHYLGTRDEEINFFFFFNK